MCHSLAQARYNAMQDDVDEEMVGHLDIDIESIDMIQVNLHSTCLFEVTNLVISPVWLVVVVIVLPGDDLDLFPCSMPVPICPAAFQWLSFHA